MCAKYVIVFLSSKLHPNIYIIQTKSVHLQKLTNNKTLTSVCILTGNQIVVEE